MYRHRNLVVEVFFFAEQVRVWLVEIAVEVNSLV